ncbi:MAG: sulfotransferase [Planctomycetaceae bacterium]|nr:sulfotransferase [Planctomycetaceae bacterium]
MITLKSSPDSGNESKENDSNAVCVDYPLRVETQESSGPLTVPLTNFFHAGFPKSATTWFHRCLMEHPDVCVPQNDAVHFLTIHHDQGDDWYRSLFTSYCGQPIVGDTTPTYAAFDWSRRRMAEYNPEARILLTLRNPIDRAFSHYWHMKKKRRYAERFEESLENKVDLYQWFIALGFYGHHLSDLYRYFPRDQVLVLLYDDILADRITFCQQVFRFLGVDASFVPSCVNTQVNTASRFRPGVTQRLCRLFSRRTEMNEYQRGMLPETRRRLQTIFRPDVEQLEGLLGRDLSHWLN